MSLRATLRSTCAKGPCWSTGSITDAGVTATLGAGWEVFHLDDHFSNKRGCVGDDTIAGLCDGVGVNRQQARLRMVEAKAGPKLKDARAQLRKGVEWVLATGDTRASELRAELHLRAAPRSSYRPKPIHTKSPKASVPFGIWVDGKQVL